MAARARSRFDRDEYGPQNDVYTGLLAISLVAMLVSCVLLFLDYNQYGGKPIPPTPPAPTPRAGIVTGVLPPPPEIGPRPTVQGTAMGPVQPVSGEEQPGKVPVIPAMGETTMPQFPTPAPVTNMAAPPTAPAPAPVMPVAPAPLPIVPTGEMLPPPSAFPPAAQPELPVPQAADAAKTEPGDPPPLPKSIKQLPTGDGER